MRYRTMSRGLYVYLIKQGFTDVRYQQDPSGRFIWSWEETDELNEAIKEFYDRPPADYKRMRNAQLVTSVWLKDKLVEAGHEPFTEEPDKFDWRKTIWLFDKTPELDLDLEEIFDEVKNKSNCPNDYHARKSHKDWGIF